MKLQRLMVAFHLFQTVKSGGGLWEKPDADDHSTAELVSKPRTEGNHAAALSKKKHTRNWTPAAFQRQHPPPARSWAANQARQRSANTQGDDFD